MIRIKLIVSIAIVLIGINLFVIDSYSVANT